MIHAGQLVAAAACLLALAGQGRAADENQARWHDVAAAVFNNRPVQDGSAILRLDAPDRALDAALVPIGITVAPSATPKALYLIIDGNPAPVAGVMHFGPLGDPHLLKLRVRIDQYSLVHAVAEMPDGRLLGVAKFVKAAGGCSAPGTTNQHEAMARIGRMKLRPAAAPRTAELLISHPNYNGMQMNPVTRFYTPARYVQTVTVTEGGQRVFSLDGDIALSQDPAITFALLPGAGGAALDVEVRDSSKAVFKQSFPLPAGRS
jgi:sulfur-oxidizing protein SoxY